MLGFIFDNFTRVCHTEFVGKPTVSPTTPSLIIKILIEAVTQDLCWVLFSMILRGFVIQNLYCGWSSKMPAKFF